MPQDTRLFANGLQVGNRLPHRLTDNALDRSSMKFTAVAAATIRLAFANVPRYAAIVVERDLSATRRLETFPESGSTLPEMPDSDYRQVLQQPYRVIYRHDTARRQVFVLAVVHGS